MPLFFLHFYCFDDMFFSDGWALKDLGNLLLVYALIFNNYREF